MDYKYDIFISHNSQDEEGNERQEKWAKDFKYFLKIILQRLLGREPEILLSCEIESSLEFKNLDLEDLFSRCAAFITILAPDYSNSKKNALELQNIFKILSNQEKVSNKKRLFKVLKTRIPREKQPTLLQSFSPFDFYEVNTETNQIKEYEELSGNEEESQFWLKLVDLAYDIFDLILALKGDKADNEEIPNTVYLAETGLDQIKNRDIIRRELQRHGHTVLPQNPLPSDPDRVVRTIRDCLEKSFMSIHLIGEDSGKYIEGSDFSIVDLQNKVANDYIEDLLESKELGDNNFTRAVWLAPELKRMSSDRAAHIEKLKSDSVTLRGAEVVQTPLEVFKSIIDNKIRRHMKKLTLKYVEEKVSTKNSTQVFLIHEKSDQVKLGDLKKWLENNQCNVILSDFLSSKTSIFKQYRQNLVESDAFIIYVGNNNQHWILSKILDILKSPGYGRVKPINQKAVFIKDNNSQHKQLFQNHDFHIINISDENTLINESFKDFFKMLNPDYV